MHRHRRSKRHLSRTTPSEPPRLQDHATEAMGPASYPTELAGEDRSMNSLVDLAGVMIPVVGSVVFFAFLSVGGWAQQKRREREAFYRHEVLKKLIEQGGAAGGQQIPEVIGRGGGVGGRERRGGGILGGFDYTVLGGA